MNYECNVSATHTTDHATRLVKNKISSPSAPPPLSRDFLNFELKNWSVDFKTVS